MLKEEIHNSLKVLKEGKTLLYPTDTVWGIGCDATSYEAVNAIYSIKQRSESKSLIILVDGLEMLQKYVENIPLHVIEVLENAKQPTTIIYNNPIGLASNVVADDHTIAIRIVDTDYCKALIREFGKPVVSTSANISGNATPKCFDEINEQVLDSVDYIVNLQRDEINTKSSTILKINTNGEISVLRK